MNAPLQIAEAQPLAPLTVVLALMAQSAATSQKLFGLDIPDVVDPLQWFAEATGMVAAIGPDGVQKIISEPFLRAQEKPQ